MHAFDFARHLYRAASPYTDYWQDRHILGLDINFLNVTVGESRITIINDGRHALPIRYALRLSSGSAVAHGMRIYPKPLAVRDTWVWRHQPSDEFLIEARLLGLL